MPPPFGDRLLTPPPHLPSRQAAYQESLELQSKDLETQLRRAKFEAGQLDVKRVAHEDEIAALRKRAERMAATIAEQGATLDTSKGVGRELAEARAACEKASAPKPAHAQCTAPRAFSAQGAT